ncbi:hypothetical protein BpHYR1_024434, partial [Brachionus plicatilis]
MNSNTYFKIKIQDQIVEKELLESQIEKLKKNIEEINTSRTDLKSRIEHYKELIDRFRELNKEIENLENDKSKNNNYKTVNFSTDDHSECSAIDQIGHNKSIPKYVHKGDEDQVVGISKSRRKANGRMVRQGPYGGIYYEIPHSF